MLKVGYRIRLSSRKGPDREGVITAMTGAMLRVRWQTEDETTVIPAPGTLTVLAPAPPTVPSQQALAKRGAPKKTAAAKTAAKRTAAKKKAATKAAPKKAPAKTAVRKTAPKKTAAKKTTAKKTTAKRTAKKAAAPTKGGSKTTTSARRSSR